MVTVVNSLMVDVRAAMWLRTTGGDDEMKGRSCRSPTPYESQLLGEGRVFHHVAQALRGGLLDPGDRIRDMRDERDR